MTLVTPWSGVPRVRADQIETHGSSMLNPVRCRHRRDRWFCPRPGPDQASGRVRRRNRRTRPSSWRGLWTDFLAHAEERLGSPSSAVTVAAWCRFRPDCRGGRCQSLPSISNRTSSASWPSIDRPKKELPTIRSRMVEPNPFACGASTSGPSRSAQANANRPSSSECQSIRTLGLVRERPRLRGVCGQFVQRKRQAEDLIGPQRHGRSQDFDPPLLRQVRGQRRLDDRQDVRLPPVGPR